MNKKMEIIKRYGDVECRDHGRALVLHSGMEIGVPLSAITIAGLYSVLYHRIQRVVKDIENE